MKAKQVSTPTVEELQDLFDLPSSIPEGDLREYLAAEQQYLNSREEFLTCVHNLTEMLLFGLPVDGGSAYSAELQEGKLIVRIKEDLCEASK